MSEAVMLDTSRQWGPSLLDIRIDHRRRYYLAALLAKGRVLDAASGCGYGSYILMNAGFDVVGVEIDPRAVAWAKQFFPGPKYLQMDLETLKGEAGSIVCFEFIEHTKTPENVLKNFREICKGPLIISTPNQDVYPFDAEHFKNDEYPHYRHYTPPEFDALLEGAGFEIRERYSQHKHGRIENGTANRFLIYVCS